MISDGCKSSPMALLDPCGRRRSKKHGQFRWCYINMRNLGSSGDKGHMAHHPAFPRQETFNARVCPGSIGLTSSFLAHEKTGWLMRLCSVSYILKTDSSPSASVCCASSTVESSKAKCTKSTGIEEIFSNVMRNVDLVKSTPNEMCK